MPAATADHERATLSEPEKDAVREQLRRLLANPFFSHSKRFPTFLSFVTEQTLAGEADNIKERTLGIEIFGRDADYDTASDPIVRVTAAEIRKRVAQYYQDPAHTNELRIALPSGSYIPTFHWPKDANDPVLEGIGSGSGGSSGARGGASDCYSNTPPSPISAGGGYVRCGGAAVSGIGLPVASDASFRTGFFLAAGIDNKRPSADLRRRSNRLSWHVSSRRGRSNPSGLPEEMVEGQSDDCCD